MSIVGLCFYLCVIFIVVLTLLFCLLLKIPCEPFEFDATKMYLYADTLNQKIPMILSIILLCSEILYFTVSLFQYIQKIEQKWNGYTFSMEEIDCIARKPETNYFELEGALIKMMAKKQINE